MLTVEYKAEKNTLMPFGVCCTEGFISAMRNCSKFGHSSQCEDRKKCTKEPSFNPMSFKESLLHCRSLCQKEFKQKFFNELYYNIIHTSTCICTTNQDKYCKYEAWMYHLNCSTCDGIPLSTASPVFRSASVWFSRSTLIS